MLTDSPLFKVIVVANIRVYYDDAGKPLTGGGTLGTQNSASVIVNGKKRIIDKTGKLIIPAIYYMVEDFKEGLAMVLKGKGFGFVYGFIDKTEKEVIPLKYEECYSFKNGLATVYIKNKYCYNDKKGTHYWEDYV